MNLPLNISDICQIVNNAGVPLGQSPNQLFQEIIPFISDTKKITVHRWPVIFNYTFSNSVIIPVKNLMTNVGYTKVVNDLNTLEPGSDFFMPFMLGSAQVCAANYSGNQDGSCVFSLGIPAYESYASKSITTFAVLGPNTNAAISGYACDGPLVASIINVAPPSQATFSFNFVGEIVLFRRSS